MQWQGNMDELCESLSVILGNSENTQHYSDTSTGYYWSDILPDILAPNIL